MKKYHIAFLTLGLLMHERITASLFSSSNKTNSMTIDCYKNVNIDAHVAEGGSLQMMLGNCDINAIQSMGKAGEVKQFSSLPPAISLGKILQGTISNSSDISMPSPGQKVLFSFSPSEGTLANAQQQFMIENVAATQLNAEIADRGLNNIAQELEQANPGKSLNLFVFYRALPNIKAGWEDLGQTFAVSDDVNSTFNVAVNSSAKLMIYSTGSDEVKLFDLAQFQLQRADPKQVNVQNVAQTFDDLLEFFQQHAK